MISSFGAIIQTTVVSMTKDILCVGELYWPMTKKVLISPHLTFLGAHHVTSLSPFTAFLPFFPRFRILGGSRRNHIPHSGRVHCGTGMCTVSCALWRVPAVLWHCHVYCGMCTVALGCALLRVPAALWHRHVFCATCGCHTEFPMRSSDQIRQKQIYRLQALWESKYSLSNLALFCDTYGTGSS